MQKLFTKRARRKLSAEQNMENEFSNILDDQTGDTGMPNQDADLFNQMYVGGAKQNTRTAAGENEPAGQAYDPNFDDLGLDSDLEEEKFFVKAPKMNNKTIDDQVSEYASMVNPAGKADTAPRKDKSPTQISAKDQARQRIKVAQAKVANAQNLASLIVEKGLCTQDNLRSLVRDIQSMDNASFGLVRKLVSSFESVEVKSKASSRTASQNVKPLHVAIPRPESNDYSIAMEDAPWSGVPEKGFDYKTFRVN